MRDHVDSAARTRDRDPRVPAGHRRVPAHHHGLSGSVLLRLTPPFARCPFGPFDRPAPAAFPASTTVVPAAARRRTPPHAPLPTKENPVRRAFLAAAAALLAAVSIVGCGGSRRRRLRHPARRHRGHLQPVQLPGHRRQAHRLRRRGRPGRRRASSARRSSSSRPRGTRSSPAWRPSGSTSIANQVTINDERKAKYDLSEPYTVSEGVIVTRADDTSITTPRRPQGQDDGAVGHQQLGPGRPRRRRERRGGRGLRPGHPAAQGRPRRRHRQRHPRRRRVPAHEQRRRHQGRRDDRRHERAGVRRPQGQRAHRRRQQGAGPAPGRRHAEADLGEVLRLRRQHRADRRWIRRPRS